MGVWVGGRAGWWVEAAGFVLPLLGCFTAGVGGIYATYMVKQLRFPCPASPSATFLPNHSPSADLHVIIFDEIDAICKQRGSVGGGTGVHDTVVNQLLTKMDGVDALNNILIIGMTNRWMRGCGGLGL